jgi:ribosomal protein S18 acetylase RimI-like enzyme
MPEPETRAVADNLFEALRFFGKAQQTGEIVDLPGVSLIFCGLNYAAFNAALLTQPIEAGGAELSRLIQTAATQFDGRNLRWTYWVCDDFLDKSLRRKAPRIFSRHGLRPLTEAPGMYAEALQVPHRALPSLQVHRVAGEQTRREFAEIMSIAFEIPHSICAAVYGSEQAWTHELLGYVGYSDGRAVTTAAAMITGDAVGLYSVATLPKYRRLGFAEAIMRQVVEQARETAGIARTVLQSTRSGLTLYRKMGYRTVTTFNVYIAD